MGGCTKGFPGDPKVKTHAVFLKHCSHSRVGALGNDPKAATNTSLRGVHKGPTRTVARRLGSFRGVPILFILVVACFTITASSGLRPGTNGYFYNDYYNDKDRWCLTSKFLRNPTLRTNLA